MLKWASYLSGACVCVCVYLLRPQADLASLGLQISWLCVSKSPNDFIVLIAEAAAAAAEGTAIAASHAAAAAAVHSKKIG